MRTRILCVLLAFTVAAAVYYTPRLPGMAEKYAAVTVPPDHPFAKIALGMNRSQVMAQLGEPTLKSERSWFYDRRGNVRFREDAVVALVLR